MLMDVFDIACAYHESGHAVANQILQPYGRRLIVVDINKRPGKDHDSGGRTQYDGEINPHIYYPRTLFCRLTASMAGGASNIIANVKYNLDMSDDDINESIEGDHKKSVNHAFVFTKTIEQAYDIVSDDALYWTQEFCSDYWEAVDGVAKVLIDQKCIYAEQVQAICKLFDGGTWIESNFSSEQVNHLMQTYGIETVSGSEFLRVRER